MRTAQLWAVRMATPRASAACRVVHVVPANTLFFTTYALEETMPILLILPVLSILICGP
jgi:hypothetical protein